MGVVVCTSGKPLLHEVRNFNVIVYSIADIDIICLCSPKRFHLVLQLRDFVGYATQAGSVN